MRWTRSAALSLCVTVSIARPIQGQVPLNPANGMLTDPVGNVSTVRELADGRILIPTGRILSIGNFEDGSIQPLPTLPSGLLFGLSADSTLVITPTGQWIILVGSKAAGMLAPSNPIVAGTKQIFGASLSGDVLTITGGQPTSDSATVWIVSRLTGVRDSIGTIWQEMPYRGGGLPAPVFVVSEQAALAPDGWIAVLRAHPYRLDWRTPSGQWAHGDPLPVATIRMSEREREAYMARRAVAAGQQPESPSMIKNWPDVVEPFTLSSLLIAPDGEALVMRTPSADVPDTRYDVIDRRGAMVRQLEIPTNARILGFGPHSVYIRVPTTPRGGRGQIERHPWP